MIYPDLGSAFQHFWLSLLYQRVTPTTNRPLVQSSSPGKTSKPFSPETPGTRGTPKSDTWIHVFVLLQLSEVSK